MVGMDRNSAEKIKTSVDQLLPVYENYLTLHLGRVFIHITGKRVFLYHFLSQAPEKTPLITEVSPLTVHSEKCSVWF